MPDPHTSDGDSCSCGRKHIRVIPDSTEWRRDLRAALAKLERTTDDK